MQTDEDPIAAEETTEPEDLVKTAPKAVEPTARQSLVDWANGQDSWVRALVDAILTVPSEVSEATLQGIYGRYLLEKGLLDGGEVEPIEPLAVGDVQVATKAPLTIDGLSAVSGVNALAANQEIDFNPNLTIIFGENGSGKTGYTRILKTLANVRTVEDILGDVTESGPRAKKKCKIRYTVDGTTKDFEWTGETGVIPFTAISIFDSPAVSLHVDDDLSYLYTPSDLALFPMVGDGINRVHKRLDEAVAEKKPKGNPFLSHFVNGTSAYSLVETLGPASDLDALTSLARTKDDAAKELDALAATANALRGGAITAQIATARARRDLYLRLIVIAKAIEGFQPHAYLASVTAVVSAQDAYRELRNKLASASGVDGEAAERWQEFVLAGETYRSHIEETDHLDDNCIYCRQSLGDDARVLLKSYSEFANDAVRQRLAAAEEQTTLLAKDLLALDLGGARDALAAAREGQEDDAELAKADALLVALPPAMALIREGKAVSWDQLPPEAQVVREDSEGREETAADLIATLVSKEADRAAELAKSEAAHRELTDRIELGSRLAAITEQVEAAKWAQRAEELSKRFRGISASLTATVKAASGSLLNTDFERRFKEESQALRAPSVGLAFPGRRGEAARRKTVSEDHKPSKVLSEGEQKVIALADFLAEASLRQIPAPIIFDDPVNSLDYRRIGEVSGRIAALSEERQVIVFTHNVWLAVELLTRFEKDPGACTYYRVSDEGGKGLIVKGVHPRWDTVKKTRGKINKAIQDAEHREGEEREVFVERTYSLIRTWCEVVVEEELFGGVLSRFAPNVAMGKLEKVKPERLAAAIAAINPIFEKACRIMEGHSQPLESLGVTPSLDDAKKDWAELQGARDAYLA
jgi:ABC-type lipoprotein export system ATPase subunit